VREFCCKNDLSRLIVDDGETRGLASRINLDPQLCHNWIIDGHFQDDRERVSLEDSRFSLIKELSCSCWMNRIQWLFVGIDNKNVTQTFVLSDAPVARVMVALTMFVNGFMYQALT